MGFVLLCKDLGMEPYMDLFYNFYHFKSHKTDIGQYLCYLRKIGLFSLIFFLA